jgi:hypothetical protein
VAVDSQGAVVVTGEFQGAADFGSFNQGDLISNGEDDVFVAKHIPGFITLTDTFGGIGADFGLGVAIDASDNIVITGSFQNQLNFHGQGHASHGSNDIFLAEYDPQLAPVWSKWVGGTGNDQGAGIATDPAGQVIVTGWCQGSVDLGGGIFASISAYDDAFVARYDATGAYVISRHFGGSGPDSAGGYGIAADGTDALVVTGAFFGTVDFGGGALVSAGADDVFVAKYGADLAAPVLSTPGAQTLSISSFPNPFNPRTMLTYTVPSRGAVNVSIFDTRGARVATLVRNETREAGAYQVGWDGRDDNGAVVSSGVYFARIEHAGATSVRKVVLLK